MLQEKPEGQLGLTAEHFVAALHSPVPGWQTSSALQSLSDLHFMNLHVPVAGSQVLMPGLQFASEWQKAQSQVSMSQLPLLQLPFSSQDAGASHRPVPGLQTLPEEQLESAVHPFGFMNSHVPVAGSQVLMPGLQFASEWQKTQSQVSMSQLPILHSPFSSQVSGAWHWLVLGLQTWPEEQLESEEHPAGFFMNSHVPVAGLQVLMPGLQFASEWQKTQSQVSTSQLPLLHSPFSSQVSVAWHWLVLGLQTLPEPQCLSDLQVIYLHVPVAGSQVLMPGLQFASEWQKTQSQVSMSQLPILHSPFSSQVSGAWHWPVPVLQTLPEEQFESAVHNGMTGNDASHLPVPNRPPREPLLQAKPYSQSESDEHEIGAEVEASHLPPPRIPPNKPKLQVSPDSQSEFDLHVVAAGVGGVV
jgi:hypothetical protein